MLEFFGHNNMTNYFCDPIKRGGGVRESESSLKDWKQQKKLEECSNFSGKV